MGFVFFECHLHKKTFNLVHVNANLTQHFFESGGPAYQRRKVQDWHVVLRDLRVFLLAEIGVQLVRGDIGY